MLIFAVKRFKAPYIKFEALNRHYKPVFAELDSFPSIIWDTAAGHCPFEAHRGGKRKQDEVKRAEVEERDPHVQQEESDKKHAMSNTPRCVCHLYVCIES